MSWDREDWKFGGGLLGIILIILSIIIFGCMYGCKKKAETFNKLTGKHLTAWDVFWLEPKIMEPVKEDKK